MISRLTVNQEAPSFAALRIFNIGRFTMGDDYFPQLSPFSSLPSISLVTLSFHEHFPPFSTGVYYFSSVPLNHMQKNARRMRFYLKRLKDEIWFFIPNLFGTQKFDNFYFFYPPFYVFCILKFGHPPSNEGTNSTF